MRCEGHMYFTNGEFMNSRSRNLQVCVLQNCSSSRLVLATFEDDSARGLDIDPQRRWVADYVYKWIAWILLNPRLKCWRLWTSILVCCEPFAISFSRADVSGNLPQNGGTVHLHLILRDILCFDAALNFFHAMPSHYISLAIFINNKNNYSTRVTIFDQ